MVEFPIEFNRWHETEEMQSTDSVAEFIMFAADRSHVM